LHYVTHQPLTAATPLSILLSSTLLASAWCLCNGDLRRVASRHIVSRHVTLCRAACAALAVLRCRFVTPDLNDGHLEYTYYACALLCASTLPLFVFCARRFEFVQSPAPEAAVSGARGGGGGGGGAADAKAGGAQAGTLKRRSGPSPRSTKSATGSAKWIELTDQ
jgi:hypothetical protein